MTWATELALPANDVLRQAGDVAGIIAKYSALTGAPTWSAMPLSELMAIAEGTIAGWTAPQWRDLKADHVTPAGNVKTAQAATRTFLEPLLTVDEWAQVTATASSQQQLWQTVGGIANPPTERRITKVLFQLSDSPQYDERESHGLAKTIRNRIQAGELRATSLANLITIDSLLGV